MTTNESSNRSVRWTNAMLVALPNTNEFLRYEIIDGELITSEPPHWVHQETCANICIALSDWSKVSKSGQAVMNPGVLLSETDSVAPDVVWISDERLAALMDEAGHLTGAPELVVEVLSPGAEQERRDRETKLKLYSQRGAREYWIVDWRAKQVEVYRRQQAQLSLVATLLIADELTSPLLPGFACPVARLFT